MKIQLGLWTNEEIELHRFFGPWSTSEDGHKATKAPNNYLTNTRLFKILLNFGVIVRTCLSLCTLSSFSSSPRSVLSIVSNVYSRLSFFREVASLLKMQVDLFVFLNKQLFSLSLSLSL